MEYFIIFCLFLASCILAYKDGYNDGRSFNGGRQVSEASELYEQVLKLEQQLKDAELTQTISAQNHIADMENIEELEQQNEQMLEALIMATKYIKIQRPFMNYSDDVELYENNIKIIESVTGKPIEEVLK